MDTGTEMGVEKEAGDDKKEEARGEDEEDVGVSLGGCGGGDVGLSSSIIDVGTASSFSLSPCSSWYCRRTLRVWMLQAAVKKPMRMTKKSSEVTMVSRNENSTKSSTHGRESGAASGT
jgi:hypothetical protein